MKIQFISWNYYETKRMKFISEVFQERFRHGKKQYLVRYDGTWDWIDSDKCKVVEK